MLKLVEPTAGAILYDGRELTPLSRRVMRPLRRHLQIIFQDPYASLNPRLRVRDIIGEALDTHGLHPGTAPPQRLAQLLRPVPLHPAPPPPPPPHSSPPPPHSH